MEVVFLCGEFAAGLSCPELADGGVLGREPDPESFLLARQRRLAKYSSGRTYNESNLSMSAWE